MKVAAVQHDIDWEDPAATFERLRPMIGRAAEAGARLVALSEMFASGFSIATERIAEASGGPSTQFLQEQARSHGIWVCGSVPEIDPGHTRPSNCLVLAAPDGSLQQYRKIHPFSYAGEHERYDAGQEHLTVDIEGVRVSCFVCYDLRFADEFWGLAARTDCYLVVANWPADRRDHWRTLLRARAIENQAYVVGVNRVGRGGSLDYSGDSAVIGPFGEELAEATGPTQQLVIADVDPAVVAATRERYPFLVDRRS